MTNKELIERLRECAERIGKMCGEGRPPHMTIPAREDDDDLFISRTVCAAATALEAAEAEQTPVAWQWRYPNSDQWHYYHFANPHPNWSEDEIEARPLFARPAPPALAPDVLAWLRTVASQKLATEMHPDLAVGADYEYAYKAIVGEARALLEKLESSNAKG